MSKTFHMRKSYLYTWGSCPTCHKGRLEQRFFITIHPDYRPDPNPVIGGPAYSIPTILAHDQTACSNSECGQIFKREVIDKKELKTIENQLRETIVLIKNDVTTIFPEDLLDYFVPEKMSVEFQNQAVLDLLAKTFDVVETPKYKRISMEDIVFNDEQRRAKRRGEPGKLFDILSDNEQSRLRIYFDELQTQKKEFEEKLKNDRINRLSKLNSMKGVVLPRGTRVRILYSKNDWNIESKLGNISYLEQYGATNKYTPIEILSGKYQKTYAVIPPNHLVHDYHQDILAMKKFWPKNIIFEKPIPA